MYAFQRFSCPSLFHPSTNRRMYRLLSKGLIGDPCGVPRPSSRLRVLRCLLPRSSVSSTGTAPSATAKHSTDRLPEEIDRKSTRLNSSHLGISYAVFCLKK